MKKEPLFFTDKTEIGAKHVPIDNTKFRTGGIVLLAPNGKPSNLSPKLYEIVRTPEFKAWFGDWENDPENASKVVDENGEPLVVYHGTDSEFNIFDKTKRGTKTDYGVYGKGFYFSKSRITSESYGNNVKSVFLNVKNIFNVSRFKNKFELAEYLNIDESVLNEYRTGIGVYGSYSGIYSDAIKDKNFNGISTQFGEYVVFEPNQIKLADGTNTTFDPNNDDIRYAGGGNIDINEPFNVNGKTLAERVRILLKQLYPDYKWSVTSSYNKLDVYLLEADFDPFTDLWKEQHPNRDKYYNVTNWDFNEYNRENKAQITDRALEVFKPIREYIDKHTVNYNAGDPYADYANYNVYENTYIGKWDKPYVQVEPKAGKKPKASSTPKVAPTPISPEPKFKVGDIITYRGTGDKKLRVIKFIEFDKEIQENIYSVESLSDQPKGWAKESKMTLVEPNASDNVFTIQNIVSKTQWSDGLKQSMIQDFVNSGYEDVTPLIGSDMRETSKNIEKKVDGFASEKNTYLQANYLADMIHILISQGNVPKPSAPTSETDNFLEYLKSNNEKATLIPRELEVMTALTLFLQSAKDIENLDADRYANLTVNMVAKLSENK